MSWFLRPEASGGLHGHASVAHQAAEPGLVRPHQLHFGGAQLHPGPGEKSGFGRDSRGGTHHPEAPVAAQGPNHRHQEASSQAHQPQAQDLPRPHLPEALPSHVGREFLDKLLEEADRHQGRPQTTGGEAVAHQFHWADP